MRLQPNCQPTAEYRLDIGRYMMQLKRGLERRACDFCHRRKIKCDRLARASQGSDKCSQCALRQVSCHVDDTDDVRLRVRRRIPRPSETPAACSQLQQQSENRVVDQNGSPAFSVSPANVDINSVFSDGQNDTTSDRDLTGPSQSSSVPTVPLLDIDGTMLSHISLPDSLFELSSDSLSFLDRIFLGDSEPPDWIHQPINLRNKSQDSIIEGSVEQTRNRDCQNAADKTSATFDAAIHAYFECAALSLPILFEDAFWQDYNAGRSSPALNFAIACRGMPFTAVEDKWQIQHEFACKFRQAFLEAQHTASTQGSTRIDELEALALMINYELDDTHSLAFDSRLGALFLTLDSLVLLTLQVQIHGANPLSDASEVRLAREEERRALLYWHVYGFDAFHTLDRKSMSRLQDTHVNFEEQLSLSHSVRGYLDAILALAVLARSISQTLCSTKSRRKRLGLDEVQSLYRNFHHWRNKACPTHLRWQTEPKSPQGSLDGNGSSSSIRPGNVAQLQRTVVGFLELNCIMQIEDCVRTVGIQRQDSLEGEQLASLVESETLSAVKDTISLSRWAMTTRIPGQGPGSRSLIDFAPHISRDICAGVCTWLCLRGQALLRGHLPDPFTYFAADGHPRSESDTQGIQAQRIVSYLEAIAALRDAVASATSHKDTGEVLARLDEHADPLKRAVCAKPV